ncbi:hypothetical protein TIFTF001_026332 [Ficus carica]|uniref:CASP-like protein n=1 Tax=Ficus carica TaxID=3494 RepID=A0AA88IYI6_FICCA|nr:hypothetical protein TIFTF001_026332 [Ficus carica]
MEGDMEQKYMSRGTRIATIALRIFCTILLIISFIILVTNVLPLRYKDDTKKVHFYDVLGFKYMIATIILAAGYQVLQTILAIRSMKWENHVASPLFVFFADKVITNLLATGAVAGFIATRDLQEWVGREYSKYESSYFKMSYASAGLFLLGFFCSLVLSVISSYALPKTL